VADKKRRRTNRKQRHLQHRQENDRRIGGLRGEDHRLFSRRRAQSNAPELERAPCSTKTSTPRSPNSTPVCRPARAGFARRRGKPGPVGDLTVLNVARVPAYWCRSGGRARSTHSGLDRGVRTGAPSAGQEDRPCPGTESVPERLIRGSIPPTAGDRTVRVTASWDDVDHLDSYRRRRYPPPSFDGVAPFAPITGGMLLAQPAPIRPCC